MQLTTRDRSIFRHLLDYGMLTTQHILKFHFDGIAKTTVLRRLRILEEAHFIKRLHGLPTQEVLWILTPKGADILGGELFKKNFNRNLLDHDYKLLELRLLLEKAGVSQSWIPEHEIKHRLFQKYSRKEALKKNVPDGIMMVTAQENKRVPVAVELELNLKSKERIKEVLKSYQFKKDLTALWYVNHSEVISKALFSEWRKLSYPNKNLKLYCSLYDDVMINGAECEVECDSKILKLKDLFPAHTPAQGVSTSAMGLSKPSPILTTENNLAYAYPP